MKTVNLTADAATAQTTANRELVEFQVNHFQARGYSEFEAWAIAFNLSMKDKEEKKFKEYVGNVCDLTDGFETENKVAYEKTTDYDIIMGWANFVTDYYYGDNTLELCKFVFSDKSNIIKGDEIIDWLEEFAADMRVEIETVTTGFDTTAIYVVGYSK